MRIVADALIFLIVAAAIIFYFLTSPNRVEPERLAIMENGDVQRGERMFYAGGCNSCHAAPDAEGDDKLKLGGGLALKTPFGTFHAPNISMHPEDGIGDWSGEDFANAMLRGVAPDGSHYYPAFPYTSYARMEVDDVADLWAYMQTLPAVARENTPHELPLAFRLRRGLGLWKLLFLSEGPVVDFERSNIQMRQGRYLVEGPGHCGECHTPRNFLGGMDRSRWLAGGLSPEGKGKIPNITPHSSGLGDWTVSDITYSLESGFTPEFDSFGGSMVSVQKNMAKLSNEDREAIAVYLKAIEAVPSE